MGFHWDNICVQSSDGHDRASFTASSAGRISAHPLTKAALDLRVVRADGRTEIGKGLRWAWLDVVKTARFEWLALSSSPFIRDASHPTNSNAACGLAKWW